jgi:hypothetical protein
MSKQRISSRSDFPHLTIWRETGKNGKPIFTIAFVNKEVRTQFAATAHPIQRYLAIVGWFLAVMIPWVAPWYFILGYAPEPFPYFTPVCAGLGLAIALWGTRKPWVSRQIDLDFAKGEIRVKRRGRVTLRKPAALMNLALEQCPVIWRGDRNAMEAAYRQHCLVGYFGEFGADRAIMVCRYEREEQHGLLEVQQAITWAWNVGLTEMGSGGPETVSETTGRRRGITPPLD